MANNPQFYIVEASALPEVFLKVAEAKRDELVKQFEQKYGPLTIGVDDSGDFSWICDPWPWEKEAN